MFASVALAARIERAEAALTASIGRAILDRRAGTDAFVEEIGGGVAAYTGPASPMNKMIGVGFGPPPPAERLATVEALFAARRSPLQAEVATLADPALAATLTRRGYVLENFENVLGRRISAADADVPLDSRIDIRPVNDERASREWLDVALTGFQHADAQGVQAGPLPSREALEAAMQPFVEAPGFERYSAYVDGRLAGVATVRFDAGLAQLCGAATLPAFRRRGIQTTLLRRRLGDAFHRGCDIALMTTQPGSKSQENGYRQGFLLLYSRAILIRHPE